MLAIGEQTRRIAAMQEVSLRKVKPGLPQTKPSPEEIMHFTLQNLLPVGHVLALNSKLGILSELSYSLDWPRMIAQQQFTDSEIRVLMPLLDSYPHYCPYEVLLANFTRGCVTDITIAESRRRLQEAQIEGVWDQEMRPIRNVLSRTRIKMRSFGIEISSILETGYILMYISGHKKWETAPNDPSPFR